MRLIRRKAKTLLLLFILFIILGYLLLHSRRHDPMKEFDYGMYGKDDHDHISVDTDYNDPFESFLIKDLKVHNKIKDHTCLEQRNFVFIKTMKCATQTMVQILRRFGYRRHLNFVLPKGNNIYIGWPYIPEPQDYRKSSQGFNALVEHSVYNETVMKNMMPVNTRYVTILREPFSQFKSAFHYFNVANITKMKPSKDQVFDYLHNLESYEHFYKSSQTATIRYCIPDGFSVTKNMLSHCLGMPLGFPAGRENIASDFAKVQEYISTLDRNFMLVMIMEYFHESLVLLKRLMCWSLEDIIYHTTNVGVYSYKNKPADPDSLKIYKQWSHLDFILYDHFNRSFWKKVEKQGKDFFEEVKEYNTIQEQVSKFCSDLGDGENMLRIPASSFSNEIEIKKDYCMMLGVDLLTFLKTRSEREEEWPDTATQQQGTKRGC
ncbi:galactosylceramide sulfotransferase-like [Mya arenaria]|uniref:galactosylceramide sulfotransferase-like n=1 Tax=Mya arenaria TaxID=6604 RepID=UPI0022E920A1|nr:galactosylceramide sulfotransferase-like [Mya arenaria]